MTLIEHPKMVRSLLTDFDLSLRTRNAFVKHITCENPRNAVKEA